MLSPLPVASIEEEAGEKVAASIDSPWPEIEAEHLDTGRTLKTACGAYCNIMLSSTVFSPGFSMDEYMSLSMSRTDGSVSVGNTASLKKNLYGVRSEGSYYHD